MEATRFKIEIYQPGCSLSSQTWKKCQEVLTEAERHNHCHIQKVHCGLAISFWESKSSPKSSCRPLTQFYYNMFRKATLYLHGL